MMFEFPKNHLQIYFSTPLDNYFAMIQFVAGAGVVLIGIVLVPLLANLFSVT